MTLSATEQFRENKKTAEKRIFELVNSKIDDLVETAEYEWTSAMTPEEPSNYMQTLTRYLSNIMNSTLLGLPREIKELIYFDALSHAANKILALPLSPDVKKINPNGVAALSMDVNHLTDFVDGLENGFMLRSNLDELEQTISLLLSDNTDEFFDVSTRNKKYGRVDAMNGPILLEKYVLHALNLQELDADVYVADLHRKSRPLIRQRDNALRTSPRDFSSVQSRASDVTSSHLLASFLASHLPLASN